MNKLHLLFWYIGIIIPLLFITCKHPTESNIGLWNDETSTFLLPEEQIIYKIPTDIANWAIADSKNLPPKMIFFGIDTSEEVCVGIFKPSLPSRYLDNKIIEWPESEIETILKEMTHPDSNQRIISDHFDMIRDQFSGKEVWWYSIGRMLIDNSMLKDTISLYYHGFIFDGLKSPYGIVLISISNSIDSATNIKYLDGLQI